MSDETYDSFMLTKRDDIRYFSLLSLIGRCKIEVATGIGWRVSNIQIAKKVWGTKSRTLRGTLAELLVIQEAMIKAKKEGTKDA